MAYRMAILLVTGLVFALSGTPDAAAVGAAGSQRPPAATAAITEQWTGSDATGPSEFMVESEALINLSPARAFRLLREGVVAVVAVGPERFVRTRRGDWVRGPPGPSSD